MPPLDPEKQRAFAVEIVRTLRERGFEAYWAGGCVRDWLLGYTPKDYDVATSARPEEIRDIFGMRRTVAIGASFGVIAVIGPKPAGQIDVATFRRDLTYSDGRRPDAVEFGSPEADAQRRDFTINGLFYDPVAERVIDYVGGQDDLARRVVRAIGDPAERFAEDKLRLLRAVRFAATLDFALDPATRRSIEAMASEIAVVSAERIAAEMRMMLVARRRAGAMTLLRDVGLLEAILPEVAGPSSRPTAGGLPADEAWRTTLRVLEILVAPTFPLALAALLQEFVDGPTTDGICRRWKLANHDTHAIRWLVEHRGALRGARAIAWPKLQRVLISAGIEDLLALHEAIALAAGALPDDVGYCRKLLEMPRDELDPPPLLTGDDLIAHGVPRGKQYHGLLEAVRDAQLEKRIATKEDALALVDRLRAAGPEGDAPRS